MNKVEAVFGYIWVFIGVFNLSANILDQIKSRGLVTIRDLVILTGANRNTVKKHLERKVRSGGLLKNGKGKGTWYISG